MKKAINLTAVLGSCDNGGYIAYLEAIEDVNSEGETFNDTKENLFIAINLMFEESRLNYNGEKFPGKENITQTLLFSSRNDIN